MTNKYFHELTDNEFQVLIDNKTKWIDLPELHPQPIWCQYPDALNDIMGCWSLVYREVTGEDFCKDCDCYNDTTPSIDCP